MVGATMDDKAQNDTSAPKRGFRFWLVILSLATCIFISALELSGVATALPVIVSELHGSQFVWVGSAYALAATAFLPTSGGLAQVFGRQPVMLASLFIFAVGSAICGAAPTMNILILGRTIQGLGGGGLASISQIVMSDIVSLQERGKFNGLLGISWAVASGSGPLIGGACAEHGQWRWLFYLNIPVCGLVAALVLFSVRLKTPGGTLKEKLGRMDWIGNIIVIASSTSCMIALTWGGVQFPWSSAHVLVPLILGLLGLAGFLAYEAKLAQHPIVPFSFLSTRTGLSGYLQTFFMPIALAAVIYYMAVYFQVCQGASPIASGVDSLGMSVVTAPFGVVAGLSVAISKRYRPQLWASWVLVMVGCGLLSTLNANSSLASAVGYLVVVSIGLGISSSTTYFPVLAPLPVKANANAIAFFTFVRNFAMIWGVTIGGTILQNQLKHNLPLQFFDSFPEGTEIAYSIIPLVRGLEQPLKDEVRVAFAKSLSVIWKFLVGIGGLGLLSSFGMKHLPLHTNTDKDWGVAASAPPDP